MIIFIVFLLIAIGFVEYCLCVSAKQADDKTKEYFEKKWKM